MMSISDDCALYQQTKTLKLNILFNHQKLYQLSELQPIIVCLPTTIYYKNNVRDINYFTKSFTNSRCGE